MAPQTPKYIPEMIFYFVLYNHMENELDAIVFLSVPKSTHQSMFFYEGRTFSAGEFVLKYSNFFGKSLERYRCGELIMEFNNQLVPLVQCSTCY
jgi:hypothetical protein